MDVEQIREYCLSLHTEVEESMPFDKTSLVMKIGGKMFALINIESAWLAVKCDPELAIELREQYEYVTPAYHFNKKHWNGIDTQKTKGEQIRQWIDHSFDLVKKKNRIKT